jgi:hypothetical protein
MLNKADDRSSRAEDRSLYEHDERQNSPAAVRRAALAALEREFRDLLSPALTH